MPLRRPVSCPSQARLLHSRGDLRGTRSQFNVHLPEPSPIVRPGELHCKAQATFAEGGWGRTGMQLKRAPSGSRLVVTEIDRDWRRKTPASRWNYQENQQAHRGDYEYVSHAIQPGDRISVVNEFGNATGMLGELQNAGSYTIPKELNLEISRDVSDVLQPLCQAPPISEREIDLPSTPDTATQMPERTRWQPPRSPEMDMKRSRSGGQASTRSQSQSSLSPPTKPPRHRPPVDTAAMKLSPPGCSRPWSGDEASTRSPSVSSREASVTRSASNAPRLRKGVSSASSPVLTQAGLVTASR